MTKSPLLVYCHENSTERQNRFDVNLAISKVSLTEKKILVVFRLNLILVEEVEIQYKKRKVHLRIFKLFI